MRHWSGPGLSRSRSARAEMTRAPRHPPKTRHADFCSHSLHRTPRHVLKRTNGSPSPFASCSESSAQVSSAGQNAAVAKNPSPYHLVVLGQLHGLAAYMQRPQYALHYYLVLNTQRNVTMCSDFFNLSFRFLPSLSHFYIHNLQLELPAVGTTCCMQVCIPELVM